MLVTWSFVEKFLEKVRLPKSIVIIQKCEWKFVISSFAILLPS